MGVFRSDCSGGGQGDDAVGVQLVGDVGGVGELGAGGVGVGEGDAAQSGGAGGLHPAHVVLDGDGVGGGEAQPVQRQNVRRGCRLLFLDMVVVDDDVEGGGVDLRVERGEQRVDVGLGGRGDEAELVSGGLGVVDGLAHTGAQNQPDFAQELLEQFGFGGVHGRGVDILAALCREVGDALGTAV